MAEKRSKVSNYKSRHGGGWLTAQQLLAEILMERKASREKKDLPSRFWELESWRKPFLYQVRKANELLKLYEPGVIIKVVRGNKNLLSLGTEELNQLLRQETNLQKRLAARPAADLNVTTGPRPSRRQSSKLSVLRDE